MKQLTLEHLASYLPYGVNIKWVRQDDKMLITSTLTISDYDFLIRRNQGKPILRPLSDLTKEIEHNGERFVPIEWLEEKYYTLSLHKECERLLEEDGYNWINHMSHLLVIHLYKWHFDTQNLIEQGLAIDLNKI